MDEPNNYTAFLQEEVIKSRWHIQQLEEELEHHAGLRNALRQLWHEGKASTLTYVSGFFHAYFSGLPKRMREQRLHKSAGFQAYELVLPLAKPGRPRILHAIPTFTTGGSQQLIVDIIEGTSHEFEHRIITYNDWGMPSYVGVPIYELNELRDAGPVTRLLEDFKPDVLHVHYWGQRGPGYAHWQWYYWVFQAGFRVGCRVVENCNNPLVPYLDKRIDSYVYVSEYAQKYFGVPDLHNTVVYPGSNFSLFTRPVNEQLPTDTIGMVYRLDRDKLNAEAIDVFIKVVQQRPQTRVIIVGSGFFYEEYQQKVAAAGLSNSFEFTGMVSYHNLPAQYKRLSLFVAPVHKESFGQVTPFAMNMRLPVVGYSIGALPEILANEEVLAAPGDSTGLANRIVTLLNKPAELKRIGIFNRDRAQEFFGLGAMVDGYSKLYSQLLAEENNILAENAF